MKFETTREGCREATEWLKKNDRYEEFMNNSLSIDGYSLVHTANYHYDNQADPARVKQ